jgi:hypothetical protein
MFGRFSGVRPKTYFPANQLRGYNRWFARTIWSERHAAAMGEAFLFPRQWQAFGRACHLLKNSGDWDTGPKWHVVFQRSGTPSLFDSSNTTVSLRAPTAQRAGELAAVTKFHQILQKPKNWTMRVLSEAEVTPPTSDFTAPGAWPKRDKQHLDIFGQSYDDIPF